MNIFIIEVLTKSHVSVDIEVADNHQSAVLIAEKLRRVWAKFVEVGYVTIEECYCKGSESDDISIALIDDFGDKDSLPPLVDYTKD